MRKGKKKISSGQRAAEWYQDMTDSLVTLILDGQLTSWEKTWKATAADNMQNPTTGTIYGGQNVMALWVSMMINGYEDPRWGTFSNIRSVNGCGVRKGERGTRIMFWQMIVKEDEKTGDEKAFFVSKIWTVFNYSQADGMPERSEEERRSTVTGDLDDVASRYIEAEGIGISFGGDLAFYNRASDRIRMPHKEDFASEQEFTSTLFHELAHSTGHGVHLGVRLLQPGRDRAG